MMAPITSSLVAFMASSLIQPVSFSLKNAISGKRVMRVGEVIEKEKALPLEKTLFLMMKVQEKELQEQKEDLIMWIMFFSAPFFKQYQDY